MLRLTILFLLLAGAALAQMSPWQPRSLQPPAAAPSGGTLLINTGSALLINTGSKLLIQ